MNKYEDNLHLCCTFSFSHSPYGSTEGRDRRECGGGNTVLDFQKEPLGIAFVYVPVHALVCAFCVFVCACAHRTIALCVCVSPSECAHRH